MILFQETNKTFGIFLKLYLKKTDQERKRDQERKTDQERKPDEENNEIIKKKIDEIIKDYLNKFFPTLNLDFLLSKEENNELLNLFFWSILSNRIEISKIFWRLGKVCKGVVFIKQLNIQFY